MSDSPYITKGIPVVTSPRVYLPQGVGPFCKCGSRFWWRTARTRTNWWVCESCSKEAYYEQKDEPELKSMTVAEFAATATPPKRKT